MAGKYCQICNKPSGIYPLCKEHLELIKKGQVIKNKTTNKWEMVGNPENNEYHNTIATCCVCGKNAPQGKQCKECYFETLDYKSNIDKNRKANELREWYYNLRNSLYRQNNKNKAQTNINKLIALAILCKDIHGDDSLISRVYNDISDINKNIKNDTKQDEALKNYDANKNDTSGQVKCVDGHWVENDLEREIDDMLYALRRPHVYAKKVNEITSRAVKSDWFIPVLSDTKGIYIELWGMETEDYIKNKEEKINLYNEEELPLIQIYRKDVLSDKALLKDNLELEINKIEKELKKRK